jgi:hypothetical protein
MGDFFKGLPNGFGLHVAYSKSRIVSVFPLKKPVPRSNVSNLNSTPDQSMEIEI